MGKFFAALLLLLAMGAASSAKEADALTRQAVSCLNIPKATQSTLSVTFEVTISSDGRVTDISVIEYSPETEEGKLGVRAASRAIERCAPYEGVQGQVRVTVDASKLLGRSGFIDPFK